MYFISALVIKPHLFSITQRSLAAEELSSSMLNLQQDLEHLKAEQSKEQGTLGKILSQLSTLIFIHKPMTGPGSARMIDSEIQTSPGLLERFCVMSAEKEHESKKICNRPVIYSGKAAEQKTQNRNVHALPVERQQTAVTEEVSPDASQRLWCAQLVETRPSGPLVDVQSTVSIEDLGGQYLDSHLEPEKPLHVRENLFVTVAMPPLKVPKKRQKPLNYRGKKRALVLPQRQPVRKKGAVTFSKDSQQNEDLQCEQKDRVPLASLCDNRKMTNKSVAENHLKLQQQAVAPVSRCVAEQPLNPFSWWSEDTDSSQMMVEYKMSEWENVVPKPIASAIEGEGGLWQLFDFTNDSE